MCSPWCAQVAHVGVAVEGGRIKRALGLMGGGAVGKLLGVVREMVIAWSLGAGGAADGLRGALTTTLGAAHFVTNDALNAAYVPLASKHHGKDPAMARALYDLAMRGLGGFSVLVGLVLFAFAVPLVRMLYPGYAPEDAALTVQMLRISAVGVPLYIISGVFAATALVGGEVRTTAMRPLMQNLGMIGGAVAAAWLGAPLAIAFGFPVAYFVFVWFAGTQARRFVPDVTPSPAVRKRARAAFWAALAPLVVFSMVVQGGMQLERTIASLGGKGTVAVIDYARLLPDTLQVLVAVPLGLLGLRELAKLGEHARTKLAVDLLSVTLLLAVPASAGLFALAEPVVQVLYARGAFDQTAVVATADVLRAMAAGAWATALAFVAQRALSAQGQNRVVARIGIVGMVLHVGLSYALFDAYGAPAIGMSFSARGVLMLAWGFVALGVWPGMWRLTAVSLVAAAAQIWMLTALGPTLAALGPLGHLLAGTAIGGAFWLAVGAAVPSVRGRGLVLLGKVRAKLQNRGGPARTPAEPKNGATENTENTENTEIETPPASTSDTEAP